MRDVRFVAVQKAGDEAAADARNYEEPHRTARVQLRRTGIEVSERPREHHFGEHGVFADELAVELNELDEVGTGVIGLGERLESAAEQTEPLEEHLAYESTFVAEQLINGRGRRLGLTGDASRRKPADAVSVEEVDCDRQQVL